MAEMMTEDMELDGVNMIAGMVDRMPDRVAAGEAEMLYEYNVRGKDNAVCVLGATTPISARNWRITVWREI